jgi:hypothetical protein
MTNIKHIGRIKNNKRRAIVAYRTIPNDPYSALVVLTEGLPADEHDALIKLVESPSGQQADELADAMSRTYLPDGRNMLAGFHYTGQLKKVATSEVEMTPNNQTSILLNELNEVIAQQKGISIGDLAIKNTDSNAVTPTSVPVQQIPTVEDIFSATAPVAQETLSEVEMAAKLRSTADALFKEAQALRKQAEAMDTSKTTTSVKKPTAKKATIAKA